MSSRKSQKEVMIKFLKSYKWARELTQHSKGLISLILEPYPPFGSPRPGFRRFPPPSTTYSNNPLRK